MYVCAWKGGFGNEVLTCESKLTLTKKGKLNSNLVKLK